jgi:hypothetical protein
MKQTKPAVARMGAVFAAYLGVFDGHPDGCEMSLESLFVLEA